MVNTQLSRTLSLEKRTIINNWHLSFDCVIIIYWIFRTVTYIELKIIHIALIIKIKLRHGFNYNH